MNFLSETEEKLYNNADALLRAVLGIVESECLLFGVEPMLHDIEGQNAVLELEELSIVEIELLQKRVNELVKRRGKFETLELINEFEGLVIVSVTKASELKNLH